MNALVSTFFAPSLKSYSKEAETTT